VLIAAITLVTIPVTADLLLFCFDPTAQYRVSCYASLTIVAALQTVGIILVVAMLVTPGATAYLLTDIDHMMLIAAASGVFSSVMGTYISYHIDGATGGCIVVLQL